MAVGFFEDASLDAQAALSLPVKALALQPPAVRKSTERIFTPWKYPEKNKSPAMPGFAVVAFGWLISPAWRSDAQAVKPFGSRRSC
jgi:hypothetical protein